MLWIDEIVKTTEDGGRCRAKINPDGFYFDEEGDFKKFSFIEFIAQSFAFVSVFKNEQTGGETQIKEAFLASVDSFEVCTDSKLNELGKLEIEVHLQNQIL